MASSSLPIVDFGAHFTTPLPEALVERYSRIEQHDGEAVFTDIDAVRDRYADAGVDAAVLSQPYYMGGADTDQIATANDALLDIVRRYEEFYGLAAIPVTAGGEAAAAEFERCLDAGYHGGAVETKTDGVEVIHEELEPVFEVADRTGAPIMIHPKLNESLHPEALSDHWQLNVVFGREAAMAECISKVIHEGVFDRYSNLNLVFHHNGGNIAAFLSRIEGSLARVHRGEVDASYLKTYEEFRHQFESRVYVDTAGYYGDPSAFRTTLEALPASSVLYATDFPYETLTPAAFQKIVDAIETVRGGAERDAILGGNALDLLVNVD
ncbi:MAG: amidohydrolase family protein [Halobacteriota archaeon]